MEVLFETLSDAGYVKQESLDPTVRYEGYDEEKHCIFHLGIDGHTIQYCDKFRSKVQQLMDSKILMICRRVSEMRKDEVSALTGESSSHEREVIESFPPKPLTIIYHENHNVSSLQNPQPITIQVPGPFKFKDTKAVPWRYECQTLTSPSIDSITGVSGITRSGRCYTPSY